VWWHADDTRKSPFARQEQRWRDGLHATERENMPFADARRSSRHHARDSAGVRVSRSRRMRIEYSVYAAQALARRHASQPPVACRAYVAEPVRGYFVPPMRYKRQLRALCDGV